MRSEPPKPSPVKLTAFLLLQSCIAFLVVEAAARAFLPPPQKIFYDKAFPGNYEYRRPEHFVLHRTRFWRLKSDAEKRRDGDPLPDYRVNGHFLRGAEFEREKAPGVFRIVCLGDSNTFGVGLPEERTFCHLLGAWLEARGDLPAVEAINAGTPGYSSLQGLRLYREELVSLSPDLITLYFGWNDQLEAPIAEDADQRVPSPLLFSLQRLLGKSRIYTLLKEKLLSLRKGQAAAEREGAREELGYRPRVPPEAFARNYEAIVTDARSRGSAVVAIVPTTLPKESTLPIGAYVGTLKRLARRLDLPLVDLPSLFDEVGRQRLFQGHMEERDGKRIFVFDYVHPNAAGHQIIAEALYRFVTGNLPSSSRTGVAPKER